VDVDTDVEADGEVDVEVVVEDVDLLFKLIPKVFFPHFSETTPGLLN